MMTHTYLTDSIVCCTAHFLPTESIVSPTASQLGKLLPSSSAANLPLLAISDSLTAASELRSLTATPNTHAEAEAGSAVTTAAADGADSDLEGGEEEEDGAEGPVFDVCAAVPSSRGAGDVNGKSAPAAAAAATTAAEDQDEDDMFTDAGDAAGGDGADGDNFQSGFDGGEGDDDRAETARAGRAPRSGAALVDAYDDPEGYYNFQVGVANREEERVGMLWRLIAVWDTWVKTGCRSHRMMVQRSLYSGWHSPSQLVAHEYHPCQFVKKVVVFI